MFADRISVLLVEDNLSLAEVIKLQIQLLFPRAIVLVASRATQISTLLQFRPKLDFAVVDFFTEEALDGLEVAHLLRGRFPGLPIVAMSGSCPTTTENLQRLIEMPRVWFLPKPFLDNDLHVVIRQVMVQLSKPIGTAEAVYASR